MSTPSTPPFIKDSDANDDLQSQPVISSLGSCLSSSKTHLKTPSSYTRSHDQLFTPNTPQSKKANVTAVVASTNSSSSMLSPSDSCKQSSLNQTQSSQLQTPRQTPRRFGSGSSTNSSSSSSRKRLSGAIEFKASENVGLKPSLFPPAPSTVGFGRKWPTSLHTNLFNNNQQDMLDVKGSIKVDIAEGEEVSQPKLIVKRRRPNLRQQQLQQKQSLDDYSSEESGDETLEEGLRKVSKRLEFEAPSTPKAQVMDINYAYENHIKEHNSMSPEEDFEQEKNIPSVVENPFIGDFPKRTSKIPLNYIRFENEMELVNSRTGKKIIKPLDDFQKSIKPRQLFLNEKEDDKKEDLLRTPQNKILLPNLSHRSFNDEEDDTDERIRKERIFNPFRHADKSGRINKRKSVRPKRYDEIEYINHTSGDRVTRKMNDEELSIKPKKLNFDNC
ncbi:hypothetical protein FOA43_002684 [Brettanomyces nanus]|uniref:Uncharacterized protein n=1 Tax=Eeniella nana TaxID=13502 RepID=A0A875S0P0_EENNA|nr:uncharacterized protein FOA43_002684 [Brettanomyces nanus]QPG75331.1 hypothetical protein FOA43_002684 [Brettanomyces nanus]